MNPGATPVTNSRHTSDKQMTLLLYLVSHERV
jgi:hypothetical protein